MKAARERTTANLWLAAGDAVALVLFVVVGLKNHDEGITLAGLARTALPILGAYLVVSIFTANYTKPGMRSLLLTWVIAVPIGIAIRAIALHRAADESQIKFGTVAMIATLVFLLAWRGIATMLRRSS